MTRAQRFNAWRVVVVGTLVANAIVAATGSRVATGIAIALLLVMLALIATTPADAIKLPRGRSERIVAGGATLFAAILLLANFSTAAAATCFAILASAVFSFAACRRFDLTPWWVAFVAWNPLWLIAIRNS